jgi:hypothetical protein
MTLRLIDSAMKRGFEILRMTLKGCEYRFISAEIVHTNISAEIVQKLSWIFKSFQKAKPLLSHRRGMKLKSRALL